MKKTTRFVSDGIHTAWYLEVWHYEYIDWLENKVLEKEKEV